MKVAAERTITSQNEKLHMIMVDMSKAFDSISRKQLLNDFQKIINIDELYTYHTIDAKCESTS